MKQMAKAVPWIALFGMLAGCAQDIGDINRVQANKIRKADLLGGTWYYRQTVVDVPPTSAFAIVGEQSKLEKIRWEIQEDLLIAYRTYELTPGADPAAAIDENGHTVYAPNATPEGHDKGFKEAPVAAFPIVSHFDIKRSYNAATGEQTNVLEENTVDRPWYEREWMRVDWSQNLVTNFDFISTADTVQDTAYFVQEEEGGPDAFRREYDDPTAEKGLKYFDFVTKLFAKPVPYGCFFSQQLDCAPAEIKVRNAFLRADDREYEPLYYSDRDMSKFGYFRTERLTYDQKRGYTETGRVYLANRHAIWKQVYERDEQGNLLLDDQGHPIVIPLPEREPKPVVYFVSETMPEEMVPWAQKVADEWDRAFRYAVAAAKGVDIPKEGVDAIGLDVVPRMFVLCHNPVTADDDAACGEPGTVARAGDIRYNFMYWVDRPQLVGPLGFGPSSLDPETGEIVSGNAYVYGAAIDTYATYALDVIRILNGDLDVTKLMYGEEIASEVSKRLKQFIDPRETFPELDAKLAATSVDKLKERLLGKDKLAKIDRMLADGPEKLELPYDLESVQMQKIREHGYDKLLINDEIAVGLSKGKVLPGEPLTDEMLDELSPTKWMSHKAFAKAQAREDRASRLNLYMASFADDTVWGLAREFADRTDYDNVWQEIRGRIFKAVTEHEVGHTLGLRHNFQGSWDALNYADQYWALRKENLAYPSTIGDLYQQARQTQAQMEGKMREYQYSSIMDYGLNFNSDIHGLGKYDRAAILYAYTSGVYEQGKGQEKGYVEVFANPGDAVKDLRPFEDLPSPAFTHPLEAIHYTRIATDFPSVDDIANRKLMRYGELEKLRAEDAPDRPLEVPYMFCSDEWVGAILSCQRWDSGADPYEMFLNVARNYRNYYFFNNFKRDRYGFSVNSTFSRAYSRYFSYLPLIYQHWVFSLYRGSVDAVYDNYWMLAAVGGLNMLAEVLTMPSYGSYQLSSDGTYQLVSYSEDPSADLYVPMGEGRRLFSRYDWDSGYYLFDKVLEVGHFWDTLAALLALTSSQFQVLGVDVQADFRSYLLPYYLLFENELTDLTNAIVTRDFSRFAPHATADGALARRPLVGLTASDGTVFDPETGRLVDQIDGPTLDVQVSWTQRLYALLYGMAFYSSSYSLHYVDQAQVFRLGNGEQVDPGDGYEVVSFTDPSTGHVYAALNKVGATKKTLAVQMIERGQSLAEQYQQAVDAGDGNTAANLRNAIDDLVQDLNIMRSMYATFGSNF